MTIIIINYKDKINQERQPNDFIFIDQVNAKAYFGPNIVYLVKRI